MKEKLEGHLKTALHAQREHDEAAAAVPPPGGQMVKRPDSAFAPVGERGIILRTFEELRQFAKVAVDGGAAPEGMTQGGAAMAIQAGLERGLGPLGGLQFCTVINGNLSWNAQGALALIRNSPVCKPGTCLAWVEGEGEERKGVAVAHRIHYPEPFRAEFSVAEARQAELVNKSNWRKYRDRQLQARAIGFLARDGFSDVLGGFPIAEEAEEFDGPPSSAPPVSSPAPKPSGPDPVLEELESKAPAVIEVELPAELEASPNGLEPAAGVIDEEISRVSPYVGDAPTAEEFEAHHTFEAPPLRTSVEVAAELELQGRSSRLSPRIFGPAPPQAEFEKPPSSLRSKLGVPREAAKGPTEGPDRRPGEPTAEARAETIGEASETPQTDDLDPAAEIERGQELAEGEPSTVGREEYDGREFMPEAQEAGEEPKKITRAESLALDAELAAAEGQTPDLPGITKGKA